MIIDLRSDTVTHPTAAMREAIAQAEVGDDVYGDDPTVNALEAYVAELLGKEAAVYMPSGTMTNQVALRVHLEPGDEVILESQSHIYYYEGGGPAALSGAMCRLIMGNHGIFTAEDVKAVMRPSNPHFPQTRLICLENTHNRGGGRIFPLTEIAAIAHLCQQHSLKFHLDGARLWNACAATGIPPADYAQHFDTISVCFSKGLGAPIGSALAGSRDLMARARRFRKLFGGGMRQAGMMAAGALYALKHHRDRLRDDHTNAKTLAMALQEIDEIECNADTVHTNTVMIHTRDIPAIRLVEQLADDGVLMLANGDRVIRATTHLMVSDAQIQHVAEKVKSAIAHIQNKP